MSPGTAILFGSKPKTELMLAQSVPSIFHTKVALVASIAPNGVHLHCNVLHGDFFPVHRTAAKTSAGVGGVGHAVGRSVDSFNIPITSRLMRPFLFTKASTSSLMRLGPDMAQSEIWSSICVHFHDCSS